MLKAKCKCSKDTRYEDFRELFDMYLDNLSIGEAVDYDLAEDLQQMATYDKRSTLLAQHEHGAKLLNKIRTFLENYNEQ